MPEGVTRGCDSIHELVAQQQTEDASSVVVGIEIDRGLLVHGLVASGYQVYGINPFAVSRYRDRHATSGGESRTEATRRSLPTWCVPTATTTDRSPATATSLRP